MNLIRTGMKLASLLPPNVADRVLSLGIKLDKDSATLAGVKYSNAAIFAFTAEDNGHSFFDHRFSFFFKVVHTECQKDNTFPMLVKEVLLEGFTFNVL
jgi:hypothetical protein